ncbi:MAG: hypothetical protein GY852_03480 [bacterium]|nr:hypothetical protein [bacterium]
MGEQVNQFETLNNLPILRVIGQFRNSYIIAEGPDGMYVIDQHAGHERVLYEKVLQQNSVEIQGMLEPMTVDLTARQAELVNSEGEVLTEAGFSLEQFGERTFLLRAVPSILNQQDILKVLTEILDSLGGIQKSEWKTRVAASLACHSAIKAGQTLSQQEMVELINQLEGTTAPRTCPHGRPTVINFSAEQLESEFGRR